MIRIEDVNIGLNINNKFKQLAKYKLKVQKLKFKIRDNDKKWKDKIRKIKAKTRN